MTATIIASLVLIVPVQDTYDLSHKWAKGDSVTYLLDVKGDAEGQQMTARAKMSLAFGDAADKGTAALLTPLEMAFAMGGQEMDQMSSVSASNVVVDKHGMATDLAFNGSSGFFLLTMVATYLPAQPLGVGGTWDIDWTGSGVKMTGKGELAGIEERDGAKVCKLVTKAQLVPTGQEPGDLTVTTWYDPAKRTVIGSEGTVAVTGVNLTFTVKRG
jgi:hypothetical protein